MQPLRPPGVTPKLLDDDVLRMFEMEEPSDAAVALHTEAAGQLGVAEQTRWGTRLGGRQVRRMAVRGRPLRPYRSEAAVGRRASDV